MSVSHVREFHTDLKFRFHFNGLCTIDRFILAETDMNQRRLNQVKARVRAARALERANSPQETLLMPSPTSACRRLCERVLTRKIARAQRIADIPGHAMKGMLPLP